MNWQMPMQRGGQERRLDSPVKYSKAEIKSTVKRKLENEWQRDWDEDVKGRFYYSFQKEVKGAGMGSGLTRKEEDLITRLRFGHTRLNSTLNLIGKLPTGQCEVCGESETVEHVLIRCRKYEQQRRVLTRRLENRGLIMSLGNLLQRDARTEVYKDLLTFLRVTGLSGRI